MPNKEDDTKYYVCNLEMTWPPEKHATPGEARADLIEADIPGLLEIGWISGPYKREDLVEVTTAPDSRPRYLLAGPAQEEGGE